MEGAQTGGRPAPRPAIFVSRELLAEAGQPPLEPEHKALLVLMGQEPEVGRGQRSLTEVERSIEGVRITLQASGIELDAAFYCPHDPAARARDLRTPCDCRAPQPGLFLRARDELGIDLAASWVVTRSPVERLAATRAGIGHIATTVAEVPAGLRQRRLEPSRRTGAAASSGPLVNQRFGSAPIVVHANGRAWLRRQWGEVRRVCFAAEQHNWPARNAPEVTVLTWNTSPPNSGRESYREYLSNPKHTGMLEASLSLVGGHCEVLGQGRGRMPAMVDKLTMLLDALDSVRTPLVAGVDSYDAVALSPPTEMAARFVEDFDCGLLFGAEYSCWPRPLGEFERIAKFQRTIARGGVPYLQGGMWIGEVETCREFFSAAAAAPMEQVAQESMPPNLGSWEQPRYVWMLPEFHPRVQIDHRCRIFQSLVCPRADVQVLQ